jgi:hypothetical protein
MSHSEAHKSLTNSVNAHRSAHCDACQDEASCTICIFIKSFLDFELLNSGHIKILSEHCASLVREVHSAKQSNYKYKSVIDQLQAQLNQEHNRSYELEYHLNTKTTNTMMLLERYAGTLNWLHDLSGAPKEERIAALEAMADTPEKRSRIDNIETTFWQFYHARETKINLLETELKTTSERFTNTVAAKETYTLQLEKLHRSKLEELKKAHREQLEEMKRESRQSRSRRRSKRQQELRQSLSATAESRHSMSATVESRHSMSATVESKTEASDVEGDKDTK